MLEFLTSTEREPKLCDSYIAQQRALKTPDKPRDTSGDTKGYRYASRTLNFRTVATGNKRFKHYNKYDESRSETIANSATTKHYKSMPKERSTVYPENIKTDLGRRSDDRAQPLPACSQNAFLFNFEINGSNNFLVRKFEEIRESHKKMTSDNVSTNREKYNMLQNVSHIIKYVGVSILSLMIIEVSKLIFIFVLHQQ